MFSDSLDIDLKYLTTYGKNKIKTIIKNELLTNGKIKTDLIDFNAVVIGDTIYENITYAQMIALPTPSPGDFAILTNSKIYIRGATTWIEIIQNYINTLSALRDVNITTPAAQQLLMYDGSSWSNRNHYITDALDVDATSADQNTGLFWDTSDGKFITKKVKTNMIDNFNFTSLTDNDIIQYDATSSKFLNKQQYSIYNNASGGAKNIVAPFDTVNNRYNIKGLIANGDGSISLTSNPNDIIIKAEPWTITNLGTGDGVYSSTSTRNFNLKSISAGDNITLTGDSSNIIINGNKSIANLTDDVAISSVLNKHNLVYNTTSGKWENKFIELDDINNVVIDASPNIGHVMFFDGNYWINRDNSRRMQNAAASFTLNANHENSFIYCTPTANMLININTDANNPIFIGTEIDIFNNSTFTITITALSGVTIQSYLNKIAIIANSDMYLKCIRLYNGLINTSRTIINNEIQQLYTLI